MRVLQQVIANRCMIDYIPHGNRLHTVGVAVFNKNKNVNIQYLDSNEPFVFAHSDWFLVFAVYIIIHINRLKSYTDFSMGYT